MGGARQRIDRQRLGIDAHAGNERLDVVGDRQCLHTDQTGDDLAEDARSRLVVGGVLRRVQRSSGNVDPPRVAAADALDRRRQDAISEHRLRVAEQVDEAQAGIEAREAQVAGDARGQAVLRVEHGVESAAVDGLDQQPTGLRSGPVTRTRGRREGQHRAAGHAGARHLIHRQLHHATGSRPLNIQKVLGARDDLDRGRLDLRGRADPRLGTGLHRQVGQRQQHLAAAIDLRGHPGIEHQFAADVDEAVDADLGHLGDVLAVDVRQPRLGAQDDAAAGGQALAVVLVDSFSLDEQRSLPEVDAVDEHPVGPAEPADRERGGRSREQELVQPALGTAVADQSQTPVGLLQQRDRIVARPQVDDQVLQRGIEFQQPAAAGQLRVLARVTAEVDARRRGQHVGHRAHRAVARDRLDQHVGRGHRLQRVRARDLQHRLGSQQDAVLQPLDLRTVLQPAVATPGRRNHGRLDLSGAVSTSHATTRPAWRDRNPRASDPTAQPTSDRHAARTRPLDDSAPARGNARGPPARRNPDGTLPVAKDSSRDGTSAMEFMSASMTAGAHPPSGSTLASCSGETHPAASSAATSRPSENQPK